MWIRLSICCFFALWGWIDRMLSSLSGKVLGGNEAGLG